MNTMIQLIICTITIIICIISLNYKIEEKEDYTLKITKYKVKIDNSLMAKSVLIILVTSLLYIFAYISNTTSIIVNAVIALLIVMSLTDIRFKLVPDTFNLMLLTLAIVDMILTRNYFNIFTAIIILITFTLVAIITKGGIGGADIKCLAVLGLFFSFYDFMILLLIMCISAILGYLLLGRNKQIPLLPSILIGMYSMSVAYEHIHVFIYKITNLFN